MIVAYRSLVIAEEMRVGDKTPIHIADVERMTKGVDKGNQFKTGDVREGSLQEPQEPDKPGGSQAYNTTNTIGRVSCYNILYRLTYGISTHQN